MIIYPSELILLFVYASLPAVMVFSLVQIVVLYKKDVFRKSWLKGVFYVVVSGISTIVISPMLWLIFSHFELRALAGKIWGSLIPCFPPSWIVGVVTSYFVISRLMKRESNLED